MADIVSIHAPVRERRLSDIKPLTAGGFNSRSREGATAVSAVPIDSIEFQFTLP